MDICVAPVFGYFKIIRLPSISPSTASMTVCNMLKSTDEVKPLVYKKDSAFNRLLQKSCPLYHNLSVYWTRVYTGRVLPETSLVGSLDTPSKPRHSEPGLTLASP